MDLTTLWERRWLLPAMACIRTLHSSTTGSSAGGWECKGTVSDSRPEGDLQKKDNRMFNKSYWKVRESIVLVLVVRRLPVVISCILLQEWPKRTTPPFRYIRSRLIFDDVTKWPKVIFGKPQKCWLFPKTLKCLTISKKSEGPLGSPLAPFFGDNTVHT
jgi:hypothetical protein